MKKFLKHYLGFSHLKIEDLLTTLEILVQSPSCFISLPMGHAQICSWVRKSERKSEKGEKIKTERWRTGG